MGSTAEGSASAPGQVTIAKSTTGARKKRMDSGKQRKESTKPSERGTIRTGKKKPILWDSGGVNNGKSSLLIVLDWITNPANNGKWRGSDHNNGKTKETLLTKIVAKLVAAGIKHRDCAGVREKIDLLENQYREAENILAGTGVGVTDEAELRSAILKRCPPYYDLHDVMVDWPSARPHITSDSIDDAARSTPTTRKVVAGGLL
ncbi:hypothetical protein PR002_g15563 [Phytophthora rubi]|uniref:Myb/SANT-like domain-containing protein n=1 Tax=Phytophthora rubi TaxID=129364 RepID=A0A6A3L1P1_9STRA|nr:hypothetical protein PR002_g15563 [Phytophthora rubi]